MKAFCSACIFAISALLAAEPPSTELTGRIVPVPGNTNQLSFKTQSGDIYQLIKTPQAEALFADTNLYSKVLVLKGNVAEPSHTFAVTGNFHSLKNGKLHDLYYYCDVCSIKTSIPGLCLCCREPVRLVEEPVETAPPPKDPLPTK
jgi:hypothetical protein